MGYKSEEVLRELYWEKKLKISEIADQYDVCSDTIRYWMKQFDIDRRPKGTRHTNLSLSVEEMADRYRNGESSCEIAKDLECSSSAVRDRLEKAGIELRSISESQQNRHENQITMNCTQGYSTIKETASKKQVYVHRLVAYAKGYSLDEMKGKDVHHIDGNPWINSTENVTVLDKSDHGRLSSQQKPTN